MAGILSAFVTYVVTSTVFATSLWIYLPQERSPFADGFFIGVKKCMLFWLVMTVAAFVLMFLGPLGALIWLIVLFVGMRRSFDCGFLDTIIVGVVEIGVYMCLVWIMGKFG